MNPEDSQKAEKIADRARMVQQIALTLSSEEFKQVANRESVGGNAGSARRAINAWVNKRTGEIKAIGNFQNIPPLVLEDPENNEVTFIEQFGDMTEMVKAVRSGISEDEFQRRYEARVVELSLPNQDAIDSEAKQRLLDAIELNTKMRNGEV